MGVGVSLGRLRRSVLARDKVCFLLVIYRKCSVRLLSVWARKSRREIAEWRPFGSLVLSATQEFISSEVAKWWDGRERDWVLEAWDILKPLSEGKWWRMLHYASS